MITCYFLILVRRSPPLAFKILTLYRGFNNSKGLNVTTRSQNCLLENGSPTVGRTCGCIFQGQRRERSLIVWSSPRVNLQSCPSDVPKKLTVYTGSISFLLGFCWVLWPLATGYSLCDVDYDNSPCHKLFFTVWFSTQALKDLPDCGLDQGLWSTSQGSSCLED